MIASRVASIFVHVYYNNLSTAFRSSNPESQQALRDMYGVDSTAAFAKEEGRQTNAVGADSIVNGLRGLLESAITSAGLNLESHPMHDYRIDVDKSYCVRSRSGSVMVVAEGTFLFPELELPMVQTFHLCPTHNRSETYYISAECLHILSVKRTSPPVSNNNTSIQVASAAAAATANNSSNTAAAVAAAAAAAVPVDDHNSNSKRRRTGLKDAMTGPVDAPVASNNNNNNANSGRSSHAVVDTKPVVAAAAAAAAPSSSSAADTSSRRSGRKPREDVPAASAASSPNNINNNNNNNMIAAPAPRSTTAPEQDDADARRSRRTRGGRKEGDAAPAAEANNSGNNRASVPSAPPQASPPSYRAVAGGVSSAPAPKSATAAAGSTAAPATAAAPAASSGRAGRADRGSRDAPAAAAGPAPAAAAAAPVPASGATLAPAPEKFYMQLTGFEKGTEIGAIRRAVESAGVSTGLIRIFNDGTAAALEFNAAEDARKLNQLRQVQVKETKAQVKKFSKTEFDAIKKR